MKFTAIRLIKDEHRSMAAVLRAAEYVVGKAVSTGKPPDFNLLRAMLYYLREFPERRHHPNEDRVLFARIKAKNTRSRCRHSRTGGRTSTRGRDAPRLDDRTG